MKKIHYNCFGTCSECVDIVLDDEDRVVSVVFTGGCNGNLQGIGRLVQGMKREEVIARLRGVSCNGGPTSCPDQLARALSQQ